MFMLESPWPIVLSGIVIEALLALALLRTGRGRFLWIMLGVGVLVGGGLLLERCITTDQEAVEDCLDAIVAAAEANDINRLLENVSPKAVKVQIEARAVLNRVEVTKARLTDLETKINRLTNPPSAKVKFRVIGTGRDRSGEIPYQGFAEYLAVDLRQENGRWLVFDYSFENAELRKFSVPR